MLKTDNVARQQLEVDDDEDAEQQGLVHTNRQTNRYGFSPKCQVITLFVFTSLFMLFVGFIIGQDTASNLYGKKNPSHRGSTPTMSSSKTEPPTITSTIYAETPQPTAPKLSFSKDKLIKAQNLAKEQLKMLENYYSPYTEKVLTGNVGLVFGKLLSLLLLPLLCFQN
jgi:hypothetical protein